MKTYKQLIVTSLVILGVVSTPVATFAATNSHGNNGNSGFNTSANFNFGNNSNNSVWNRFFNWYSGRINVANAQTFSTTSTTTRKANTVPVISGITAPTVLPAGDTGTWTVNAFDPQNEALSYSVDWGDNPPSGFRAALAPSDVFTQTSTFTHSYANQGTYTITFTVTNSDGKKTTSTVTVHVTKARQHAPILSNVMASTTKNNKAVITWTSDVKGDSTVWISTTTPVDTNRDPDYGHNAMTTKHSVKVDSLTPDTTYYYIVASENNVGQTKSDEMSFHTPAVVNHNAPTITSLMGSTTIAVGDTEEVTVNAQDPNNSPLTYSVDWGDTPVMMALFATPAEVFTQTSTFTHIYENPGTYTATFTVKNDSGLSASQSLDITVTEASTTPDTTAPVFSNIPANITATATSTNGVIVTYTNPTATDNVDGNVAVTCNPASGSNFVIGSSTVTCTASDSSDNVASTTFMVTVNASTTPDTTAPVFSNIPANITTTATSTSGAFVSYTNPTAIDETDGPVAVTCSPASGTFAVGTTTVTCTASDSSDNVASTTFMVTVNPQVAAHTPMISGISESVGSATTTVMWTTDEFTDSKVFYSTTTPVDITSSTTPFVSNSSFVTSHSIDLSGLSTSTPYHFVIQSTDGSANTATSSEMTFTTTSGL